MPCTECSLAQADEFKSECESMCKQSDSGLDRHRVLLSYTPDSGVSDNDIDPSLSLARIKITNMHFQKEITLQY